MTVRKLCSIIALIVAFRVQAQTADQSIPTLHTSTRIVAVAIVPTYSNDSPVTDLKSSEIQVFDNGKKQTILSFDPMDANAGTTQANQTGVSQPASSSTTHYPHYSVILLDALNTEWSDQVFAQRAVQHLLDYLPEGEHVAIFVLSNHLYMLHDFTSNPAELRAALQHLSASMPQGGVSSKPSSPYSAEVSGADLVRLSGQMRMHNALPTAEAAFYQRIRIVQTLQTLSGIARLVKNAPGQKNLLWVSSAFPLTISDGHGGSDTFYDQERKAADDLNSAGLRIYPVDARGLTVSPSAYINIETMQQLAEQTGGKAFYNNNDLGTEMRLALEDSRKGYLLTYTPKDLKEDGSFHTIRVRTSRGGVHLRYRRGYIAESNQPASNLKPKHKK